MKIFDLKIILLINIVAVIIFSLVIALKENQFGWYFFAFIISIGEIFTLVSIFKKNNK